MKSIMNKEDVTDETNETCKKNLLRFNFFLPSSENGIKKLAHSMRE